MLEIFVVGSFWFWALLVAEIIVLLAFVEYENGIGATISVLVFGAALQWLGDVNIIKYVVNNPINVTMAVAAYFLLGTVWGIFKWRQLVLDKLELYNEAFREFLDDKNLPHDTKVLPVEFRAAWKTKVECSRDYYTKTTIADTPLVRQNKSRILRWMSFWPFGLVWYILDDFIKGIFTSIYKQIAGYLQKIADNIWSTANIQENLEVPPESRDH